MGDGVSCLQSWGTVFFLGGFFSFFLALAPGWLRAFSSVRAVSFSSLMAFGARSSRSLPRLSLHPSAPRSFFRRVCHPPRSFSAIFFFSFAHLPRHGRAFLMMVFFLNAMASGE